MIALLLALASPAHATASSGETVKFTPVLRLYECPAGFVFRSDCAMREKRLEAQKLDLNIQVLTQVMGQWAYQTHEPVPASYYVIVVRGAAGGRIEYSVSTETGLPGSPAPFANARVEFSEGNAPANFGVSSATMEKDGKNFLTEIRLTEFRGQPGPAVKGKK